MATEYDLKLVVDADTSEAQRKLDALGGGQGPAGPQPSAGAASGVPAEPSPAAQEAAERVKRERARTVGGRGAAAEAGEFGRAAGDVAGRMIGKAVAGFVAHQIAGTVFEAMKTPGGDNRAVNMAEAGVGGALQYGTMGAMIAGPVGAAVGALSGALVGFAQETVRQKQAVMARSVEVAVSDRNIQRDASVRASDQAFAQALDMAGGWRQRVGMLRARRDQIADGDGQWSVRSLERRLRGLDPDSDASRITLADLNAQKQRVAQLDMQMVQEGLPWQPGRLDAGRVTDSWARRGVAIGASVDVSQVNDRIMSEVQDCRRLLERIADMATDRTISVGAMQRVVFE